MRTGHTDRFLTVFLAMAMVVPVRHADSEAAPRQGKEILLVIPDTDSVFTPLAAHRVGGTVPPGSELRINGQPVTVYPNGAFARLLPLDVGTNEIRFEAITPAEEVLQRVVVFMRAGPPVPVPRDTLRFAEEGPEPSSDLWLRAGDILTLQCRATPGCTVRVAGKLLPEQPAGLAGGMEGLYRMSVRITGREMFDGGPLEYTLTDTGGRAVRRRSSGTVRILEDDVPIVAVTQGFLPALNHGLGKDRLGGAKLGFLEPGVPLSLSGKAEGQYRVDLAEGKEAWIYQDEVRLLPPGTAPPASYTGSVMVTGDSVSDLVTLALDQRLPWSSFQEKEPARVCVDVYGAVSNTNWITHTGGAREVTGVGVWQVGKRVFRIEIELAHPQIWGYAVGYNGSTLTVRVRRPPSRPDLEGLTIAVDAGHGGENEGAIGSTGVMEKDINLATALRLRDVLTERGASVIMTRTGDLFSTTTARLKAVLASRADLLVSIHGNSIGMASDPEKIRGVSTYYRHPCYRLLAGLVLEEVLDTDVPSFGCVGNFNFILNAPTELPTVLVEQAFLSNPADEMLLLDEDFREDMAERIADGIERFIEASAD